MISSLDIQVVEQDEGIHSDIDYDFFESYQKVDSAASVVKGKCGTGNEKCHVGETVDANVDEVQNYPVPKQENRICIENHSRRDASLDDDGNHKQTFVIEAVIEGNRPSSKGGIVHRESGSVGNVNKAKLEINLHELMETVSNGATVSSDSRCSLSEGQRLEDDDAKRCSPPRTLRDNGKYCELMNCIAFQTLVEEEPAEDVLSPLLHSGSSDTTSDLTDVTPRSLSDCSSVLEYMGAAETACGPGSYPGRQPASMKLLVDAIKHMHRSGSSTMTSSSASVRSATGRLNMTFTNEEVKKIERENGLLLKKIQSKNKCFRKPGTAVANQPRLSSSAINRRRMQQRIEHDNLILMKKIQNVKVAVNTGITLKTKRR